MEHDMMNGAASMDLGETMGRLAAAAEMLEQAAERLQQRQSSFAENAEASIGRIVATVETQRELELEQRLAAAEAKVSELQARAAVARSAETEAAVRKTLPASMATLLAKQGVTVESLEAGALDAALSSLSLEQRIAVKAQLMRSGMLG